MVSRSKAEQHAARNARLAAALRENLKRRKAQTRSRSSGQGGGRRTDEEASPGSPETSQAKSHPAPAKTPDFRRNRERD